jgi:hypothetical protein
MSALEKLLAETSQNGRVCPMPPQWANLWKQLPKADGAEPPLPLILGAWWNTSNQDKRERFELHLCWAEKYGALSSITAFLNNLTNADWHTESSANG